MKEFQVLPPVWCSTICRNAMNEACLEGCAIRKDCSEFEMKKDLKLADLPRFPDTSSMTKEERFTSVTVYLSKIVDHLQGVENEYSTPIPRSYPYYTRSGSLSKNLQVKDLLPGIQEANSSPEDRTECTDSSDRPSELAGTTDQKD